MLRLQNKTQSLLKHLQNIRGKFQETSGNAWNNIDAKVKGTFMENWLKYWKTIFTDYKEVAVDIRKDIKEKPIKALLLATGFTGICYCIKHNPDEINFRDCYLRATNDVLLVDISQQNRETVQHLKNIEKCYNSEVLRRLNCGVFSVIWIDNFSNKCNTFEAQCSYLKVSYSKFLNRIIDVGFLDNWWILKKKMENYDINY